MTPQTVSDAFDGSSEMQLFEGLTFEHLEERDTLDMEFGGCACSCTCSCTSCSCIVTF